MPGAASSSDMSDIEGLQADLAGKRHFTLL
jgi:hypothetical protein